MPVSCGTAQRTWRWGVRCRGTNIGFSVQGLRFRVWGLGFRENGKERRKYYKEFIYGLGFRENGKENGKYCTEVI